MGACGRNGKKRERVKVKNKKKQLSSVGPVPRHGSLAARSPQGRANATRKRLGRDASGRAHHVPAGGIGRSCYVVSRPGPSPRRQRVVTSGAANEESEKRNKHRLRSEISYLIFFFFFFIPPFFVSSAISVRAG